MIVNYAVDKKVQLHHDGDFGSDRLEIDLDDDFELGELDDDFGDSE
jgi:hypothetical protein